MNPKNKIIPGVGEIKLYQDSYSGFWTIEEVKDTQTYGDYTSAKDAFDSIVDERSLVEEFGWEDYPSGLSR